MAVGAILRGPVVLEVVSGGVRGGVGVLHMKGGEVESGGLELEWFYLVHLFVFFNPLSHHCILISIQVHFHVEVVCFIAHNLFEVHFII